MLYVYKYIKVYHSWWASHVEYILYGPVHKGANRVPKAVSDRDSDPFLIWKPDFTLCECKALQIRLFEMRKKGVLDYDPPRKPDSEDLWTQSSFGMWFVLCAPEVSCIIIWYVCLHFGNAHWSHAWVKGSISAVGTKLPRSVQIPFVIGTGVAMLANVRTSNHEPIQEADCDPKRLSERVSLLCELQALFQVYK